MGHFFHSNAQPQFGSVFDNLQHKLNVNLDAKFTIVREAIFVLIGVMFLALSAQVYIPLPNTPVPVTLQTYAVLTLATLYGSKRAPMTVIVYLLFSMMGFPVLSEGRGGVEVMFGATGGYLLGFVGASYCVGRFVELGWDRSFFKSGVVFIFGQLLIFAPGLIWLGLYVGYENVFAMGFLPFIPGGIVKALMSVVTSQGIWKLLKK